MKIAINVKFYRNFIRPKLDQKGPYDIFYCFLSNCWKNVTGKSCHEESLALYTLEGPRGHYYVDRYHDIPKEKYFLKFWVPTYLSTSAKGKPHGILGKQKWWEIVMRWWLMHLWKEADSRNLAYYTIHHSNQIQFHLFQQVVLQQVDYMYLYLTI